MAKSLELRINVARIKEDGGAVLLANVRLSDMLELELNRCAAHILSTNVLFQQPLLFGTLPDYMLLLYRYVSSIQQQDRVVAARSLGLELVWRASAGAMPLLPHDALCSHRWFHIF